MKAMKFIIIISILYASSAAKASGPAIIDDPDGFTNIRKGPGIHFEVIDSLFEDEFFYFKDADSSEWVEVTAWKARQVTGFVHKSRVKEVKDLDLKVQKKIIENVFNTHTALANEFRSVFERQESKTVLNDKSKVYEFHSDSKYNPVLDFLPSYICSTGDIEVIDLFFVALWADRSSANEMPSFAIGACFACKPEFLLERLFLISNLEHKTLILDHIEWGLMNIYNVDADGNSENAEYKALIHRLNQER